MRFELIFVAASFSKLAFLELLKPFVIADSLNFRAILWLLLQHTSDQVFELIASILPLFTLEPYVLFAGAHEDFLHRGVVVGDEGVSFSRYEVVQQNSKAPDVRAEAIRKLLANFRGHVAQGSQGCRLDRLLASHSRRKPKVSYSCYTLIRCITEHDIFKFYVSMHNAFGV